MPDPEKGIFGWVRPLFRFGGLGTAPTVAHSDIFTSSLPGVLAGPGVATTVARSDIVPIGVPWPWLTGTPPSGYILLDGSNVSRTTYAPLFALWGTTYGAGDGSTTFGLPNFGGRTFIGAGTGVGLTARTLGANGGEENHTLTTAEVPAHSHDIQRGGTGVMQSGANLGIQQGSGAGFGGSPNLTESSGGGGAHNNMMPWYAVNWITRAV